MRFILRRQLLVATFFAATSCVGAMCSAQPASPPNILIAISDDQSYPHASAYGTAEIQTPGFDAVARSGILFHNAFTPCPGCSPMRAAFLTGRHVWQIRQAGTHASSFPRDLPTFTGALQSSGYNVGYTGKPWGPGNFRVAGWEQNPVGKAYSSKKMQSPQGISANDYAANFEVFLQQQPQDQPFCFWYGGHEPHRSFGKGNGESSGLTPSKIGVPKFLPNSEQIRSDLADYYAEIQWFDQHLVRMLESLRSRGQLENTIVIVTSDNGMAFPRAKANLYEFGIHMPLAIAWPAGIKNSGRDEHALVGLIDVTATILDTCVSERIAPSVTGTSLKDIFDDKPNQERGQVFSGRERHSSSRFNSLGYPCRCVRTPEFLYIRNFAPERWPAGAPEKYTRAKYGSDSQFVEGTLGPTDGGYHDIDACPTLSWMISNKSSPGVATLFNAAVDHRRSEELYRIIDDQACLHNLVDDNGFASELELHRELLITELRRTGDPRMGSSLQANIWETYPRYSSLRWFPTPKWATDSPESVPKQPWLKERRPMK